MKKVCAGDDEAGPPRLARQGAEDERVLIATVVGGDEDAVPGGDGGAELVGSDDLYALGAIATSQVAR